MPTSVPMGNHFNRHYYVLCSSLRNKLWKKKLPWLRFYRAFSSVVRQMPGWNPQRRSTARTLSNFLLLLYIYICVLCIFVLFYVFLCCSMYCLFCVVLCIVYVYMCTVLLLPASYPIAVNKYIISYIISHNIMSHHIISYHISYNIIPYHIISYHIT